MYKITRRSNFNYGIGSKLLKPPEGAVPGIIKGIRPRIVAHVVKGAEIILQTLLRQLEYLVAVAVQGKVQTEISFPAVFV